MARHDLDEDDVRVRPKPRSRPRTKDRPSYSGATIARVVAVDRGRTTCLIEESALTITAMKSRELGKKSVVVGDIVSIVGDISGNEGTLARIVIVHPKDSPILMVRGSGRCPTCQSPIPAESISTAIPASSACRLRIASANGLRQILPRQTNRTRATFTRLPPSLHSCWCHQTSS